MMARSGPHPERRSIQPSNSTAAEGSTVSESERLRLAGKVSLTGESKAVCLSSHRGRRRGRMQVGTVTCDPRAAAPALPATALDRDHRPGARRAGNRPGARRAEPRRAAGAGRRRLASERCARQRDRRRGRRARRVLRRDRRAGRGVARRRAGRAGGAGWALRRDRPTASRQEDGHGAQLDLHACLFASIPPALPRCSPSPRWSPRLPSEVPPVTAPKAARRAATTEGRRHRGPLAARRWSRWTAGIVDAARWGCAASAAAVCAPITSRRGRTSSSCSAALSTKRPLSSRTPCFAACASHAPIRWRYPD